MSSEAGLKAKHRERIQHGNKYIFTACVVLKKNVFGTLGQIRGLEGKNCTKIRNSSIFCKKIPEDGKPRELIQ